MRVDHEARLMVVMPCEHKKYMSHNDCDGPPFTIMLDYDDGRPVAVAEVTAQEIIYAAFASLPEPEASDDTDA